MLDGGWFILASWQHREQPGGPEGERLSGRPIRPSGGKPFNVANLAARTFFLDCLDQLLRVGARLVVNEFGGERISTKFVTESLRKKKIVDDFQWNPDRAHRFPQMRLVVYFIQLHIRVPYNDTFKS